MTRLLLLASLAFLPAWATGCVPHAHAEARGGGKDTPVILELFTSEGCSSCPSADAAIAELEAQQPVAGVRAVPLAFHVDYWDELGWKDPYASHAWTSRQLSYRSPNQSSLYTPQLVVDGQAELNGSDREGTRAAIREAARRPKARVTANVVAQGTSHKVVIDVAALPRDVTEADAFVAVVTPRVKTNVTAGENRGRVLEHTSIVRSLTRVGRVPKDGASLEHAIGADDATARVVVFLQARASHAIVGGAIAHDG